MLKVAFWFDAPFEYSGGLNYIRNLLHALALVNDGSVRPVVFFASNVAPDVRRQFERYAQVVTTRVLQRWTLPWFVHKVLYKGLHSMSVVNALLKRHRIDVLSHAWFVYKGRPPCKIISWIPDFQYLHLPEMFPGLDPTEETRTNRRIVEQSELVILSSHHALQDFKRIAPPGLADRGRVLNFVSQPQSIEPSERTLAAVQGNYGLEGRFFLLPNQFWAHKNHLVVLQAVERLNRSGLQVQVVCTGNTRDYRYEGTPYVDRLRAYIAEHGLQTQIHILGLIDYGDLLFLMRHCVAVINPSRFEGWSSSVEEAKSMGKAVVLSRIPVHEEQRPAQAAFFEPDDVAGLAEALRRAWQGAETAEASHREAERTAREALHQRTLDFGRAYLELLHAVARGESAPVGPALLPGTSP